MNPVSPLQTGPGESPDDQLSGRQAAAIAGVAYSTWRKYLVDGYAPPADGTFNNSNWWYRRTITTWKANRPGQGARTDLHAREGNKPDPTDPP